MLLTLGACGGEPAAAPAAEASPYQVIEGSTMGTYYRVTTDCAATAAGTLRSQLDALLAVINGQMSNYDPASELSRLNRSRPGDWLPVSAPLLDVFAAAQTLSALSDGAFDITIAPVLRLWGFGPDAATSYPPPAAALQDALTRVDSAALQWQSTPRPAARRLADVEVDLSAIAKGYGVDRLHRLLRERGCPNSLVDIGGEVRGSGRGPRGAWRIGIEVPDASRVGAVQKIVRLEDSAVATSGDYRNFIDRPEADGGRSRWSHTIDPRTGNPVTHGLASVTVISPSAMLADGWATALTVLGPEAGLALANEQGLPALFIVRTATGFEERYTDAFSAWDR